jgi:hypothetical protein
MYLIFSNRPMWFGLLLHNTAENKENARPYVIREDSDTDSGDAPVRYQEDYDDEKSNYSIEISNTFAFFCITLAYEYYYFVILIRTRIHPLKIENIIIWEKYCLAGTFILACYLS